MSDTHYLEFIGAGFLRSQSSSGSWLCKRLFILLLSEMHTPKVHAHEMHSHEVRTRKIHAREVHAHEVYACKIHAHEMHESKGAGEFWV
jgi:hypothetical protein